MDYEIIIKDSDKDNELKLFDKHVKYNKYNDINDSIIFTDDPWILIKNTSKYIDNEILNILYNQNNNSNQNNNNNQNNQNNNNQICKLYFENNCKLEIYNLPDYITHIECDNEFMIRNLPSNLLYLSINKLDDYENMSLDKNEYILSNNTILKHLPRNLLYLSGIFYDKIQNLPNNIIILKIINKNYKYRLTNLPNSIKILMIPQLALIDKFLYNIPSNIKEIYINNLLLVDKTKQQQKLISKL
jgi:hypothetical protein